MRSTTCTMTGRLAVVIFFFVLGASSLQAQLTANSFTSTQAPYAVGANPSAIIAVDLDGDQMPELVVTSRNQDNVRILQNQGNGTFATLPVLPTGGDAPAALVAGNFNTQTAMDLVVANEGDNTVTMLPNDGTGAFGAQSLVTTTTEDPIAIATGHFDNNTTLDLAVANYSADPPTVTVLLNNGNNSFTSTQVNVGVGACCNFPRGLVAADIDGDGNTDLAVAIVGNGANGQSDRIVVLLNDGTGEFTESSPVLLPVEDSTCNPVFGNTDQCHFLAIATADVNGDGFPDLAVAVSQEANLTNRSKVLVLLNLGEDAGSWLGFGEPQVVSLPTSADPRALALADVDGDGAPDLITANHRNNSTDDVSVRLNNGNGTFGALRSFTVPGTNPRPIALTVADLNGDCALDIAVANSNTNTVAVLLNNIPQSCPSRDTNADGRADIVWRNLVTGKVIIWLLDGLKRIGSGSPGTVSNLDWQIVGVGDTDGNGTADLIWHNATTGKVTIWSLDGLKRTATGSPGTVANLDWQIAGIGDTNCDGKADLIWHNSATGRVSVWLLNGLTRIDFGSPGTLSDTAWEIVGVGDVNNDCSADLVWRHNTTGEVLIWGLDGTTLLSQGSPGTVGGAGWYIRGVGDTDGDGKADLVWHSDIAGIARVWRLNGFTRLSNLSPGTMPNLAWQIDNVSDTNGDGKADIVWRHSGTGKVLIWLLDGATQIGSGSPGRMSNLDWQIQ